MKDNNLGSELLMRDLAEEPDPPPCFVRHPDAGGLCERTAVIEVYDLPFCEVHGAEAKAGALEETYYDAANSLGILNNPSVTPPNPVAVRTLREALARLQEAEVSVSGRPAEEALKRAYPLIRERMDDDAASFDYQNPELGDSPIDWHYHSRMLIHRLMRTAYEAGSDFYLVEMLEVERERVSAQLAFALADCEERVSNPTSKK